MRLNDLNLNIVRRISTQINYVDSIFFLRKKFALIYYVSFKNTILHLF